MREKNSSVGSTLKSVACHKYHKAETHRPIYDSNPNVAEPSDDSVRHYDVAEPGDDSGELSSLCSFRENSERRHVLSMFFEGVTLDTDLKTGSRESIIIESLCQKAFFRLSHTRPPELL